MINKNQIENLIKIILVVVFFICLLDMSYGYYEFIRFFSFISFGFLAFKSNERGNKNEMFLGLGLALLFQPFLKLALGRTLWNIIDVIVGLGLLFSIIYKKKRLSK
jgi:hypothetical protein